MNRTKTVSATIACARCGGNGFWDGMEEEWRCLQCGRTVASATEQPKVERRAA